MISIVMPIRNAEAYLVDCLESIRKQSLTNWQLLAINDHSTDKTESILEHYAIKDKRIQHYKNKGKGIIDALQMAYSLALGDSITRMDADDLMPIDKLAFMHKALTENPKSVVTGKVRYIAEDKLFDGYKRYEKWLNNLVDNHTHFEEIYKECVIASPCWMITRSQFEKCGAFRSKIYPEDYDLVFRFYENKIAIKALNQTLHIWRDHGSRASRNDKNYADNSFIKLKTHYFLKIDFDKCKNLVLWGAGKKAKRTALELIEREVSFDWVCNNKNKIGHVIYTKILQDVNTYFTSDNKYQCIVQVANKEAQNEISNRLQMQMNITAFWFC